VGRIFAMGGRRRVESHWSARGARSVRGREGEPAASGSRAAGAGEGGVFTMKRIYERATADDGYRVLVDRLWPRGVKKEDARLDAWEKAVAPSDALRRWYGHDPRRWEEFQRRYEQELAVPEAQAVLDALAQRGRRGRVTLVYSAKDGEISNATVLLRVLRDRVKRGG
jgi:uncharacterized protein YeaO (DUF488 family)